MAEFDPVSYSKANKVAAQMAEMTKKLNKQMLVNRLRAAGIKEETVTFVGDSITAISSSDGYEYWNILCGRFGIKNAVDYGIAGARSATILGQINTIKATRAKVYVVNIGINDVRYQEATIQQYIDNIDGIWRGLRDSADVYFVSIWPTFTGDSVIDPAIANPLIDQYNAALETFCLSNGIPYIDATSAIRAYITDDNSTQHVPDGVHPNASGRRLYADAVQGIPLGTGSISPYNTLLVYDSFDREDSAESLGTADTKQAWEAIAGTWGISGGQAYRANASGGSFDVACIDTGKADCVVSATFNFLHNANRLALRVTDANNMLMVFGDATSVRIQKYENGSLSQLKLMNYTTHPNDRISVVLYGATISVWVNGVFLETVNSDFNKTATKHGLCRTASGGTDLKNDDFEVMI